jgi:hypothetical protein
MFHKLVSLINEDTQDDYTNAMRKRSRFPKSRFKTISFFLSYQNHFAMNFPLKEKLGDLEEDQLQPNLKANPLALETTT